MFFSSYLGEVRDHFSWDYQWCTDSFQDWIHNLTDYTEGVIVIGANNTFMIHLEGASAGQFLYFPSLDNFSAKLKCYLLMLRF